MVHNLWRQKPTKANQVVSNDAQLDCFQIKDFIKDTQILRDNSKHYFKQAEKVFSDYVPEQNILR